MSRARLLASSAQGARLEEDEMEGEALALAALNSSSWRAFALAFASAFAFVAVDSSSWAASASVLSVFSAPRCSGAAGGRRGSFAGRSFLCASLFGCGRFGHLHVQLLSGLACGRSWGCFSATLFGLAELPVGFLNLLVGRPAIGRPG